MKKIWSIRKKEDAVSPVIATILMVAITVVLAAVLYVMVLGFGGTQQTTPVATYSKATISNGVKITIVSISKTDVIWDDVKIQLSDGTNFAEWSPIADNLDNGSASSNNLGSANLGALGVTCIVFDIAGNGYVSGSDYFTLTASSFSSTTTYTAVLVYKVTGERIGTGSSFTG